RLEGGTHFIDAGGQTVETIRIIGFARIIRIEIRFGDHCNDLTGIDVGDHTGRSLGFILFTRSDELVPQRILYAQVDCKFDRPLQLIGGEARHMQRSETLSIKPFFNSGDPLVVDVHMANLVRDDRPAWIDTFVLRKQADAGNAEAMNFRLLAWRDLALEPDETTLG